MNADGRTQNNGETRNNGNVQDGSRDTAQQQSSPAAVPAGVLPNKAAEDDPRRWGDEPGGYDHDSWLEEQKPPHWG